VPSAKAVLGDNDYRPNGGSEARHGRSRDSVQPLPETHLNSDWLLKEASMRTFYFVGGPTPGHAEAFFRRLEAVGGPPSGWCIYPHACGDGKALHIVRTESDDSINAHLAQFTDIYEATPPIEVTDTSSLPDQRGYEATPSAV
jgi:hypothetical protein